MDKLFVTRDQMWVIMELDKEFSSAVENKGLDYRFACAVNSVINGVTAVGPLFGKYELVVKKHNEIKGGGREGNS